ncbi:hypothetical protein M231_03890 [Tremella mesenterica]|uniref:Uncharacterized protein n=1 Tax=Tremella mesenterica TaxID=5217 RepID=A0A4Q1BM06_TREME|nr:hypothetical protein M231_03890 [Tremella mesenterica]
MHSQGASIAQATQQLGHKLASEVMRRYTGDMPGVDIAAYIHRKSATERKKVQGFMAESVSLHPNLFKVTSNAPIHLSLTGVQTLQESPEYTTLLNAHQILCSESLKPFGPFRAAPPDVQQAIAVSYEQLGTWWRSHAHEAFRRKLRQWYSANCTDYQLSRTMS